MPIDYQITPYTKEIQEKGLEILIAFHDICEANQLNYILDFGTLLGAVRHQGFIPWDDDIDVAMPRKDFEQFKRIAETTLPKPMFLQTHATDPNYYNMIAKIRIPDERYTENALQYFDIVHGPWLDIFIYDNQFDDPHKEQEKQARYNRKRQFYPKLIAGLYSDPNKSDHFLQRMGKNIFRTTIKYSQRRNYRGCLMRYFDRQYAAVHQLIKNNPPQNSFGHFMTYTFPLHSDYDKKRFALHQDHFTQRQLQSFEKFAFYIPKDYHALLTARYGEYMQLPPYADRKSNHHWVHDQI